MSRFGNVSLSVSVADPDPFDTDRDLDLACHFDTDLVGILLFNFIRIQIRLLDPDLDFKEVIYPKQFFLYILTLFSLLVCPT
jgi:hypothetical protein